MSICEYMLRDASPSNSGDTDLRDELIWGRRYRNLRETEKRKPLAPPRAPADVPFRICRARAMKKRKKKPIFEGNEDGKKRRGEVEKPSLLDRSIMTQSEYMEFLSMPTPRFREKVATKKAARKCELEPCPPRLVKLAIPNKRRVYANWKDYQAVLPAEMLMRYEQILHTDHNLEPREARYYYKTLDRQNRRKLIEKKRAEKTERQEKEKRPSRTRIRIDALASRVVDYVRDEPLFALNYKQMLISDGVLERLDASGLMKKPSRKTGNFYKRTVIEIADKLAVWIDAMTRFVDVQAVESDEDVPPLSISSLSEYEDEEEDEEEEEGGDEVTEEEEPVTREELTDREQVVLEEDVYWAEEDVAEDLRESDLEGVVDEDQLVRGEELLDEELLAKLVEILGQAPDDFLDGEVDAARMPGLRYRDILDKLQELRAGVEVPASFLEAAVVEWALKNDPEKVDRKMMEKIREVSAILNEWASSFRDDRRPDDEGEGPEEEEEEERREADAAEEEREGTEEEEERREADATEEEREGTEEEEERREADAAEEEREGTEGEEEEEGERRGQDAAREENETADDRKNAEEEEDEEEEGQDDEDAAAEMTEETQGATVEETDGGAIALEDLRTTEETEEAKKLEDATDEEADEVVGEEEEGGRRDDYDDDAQIPIEEFPDVEIDQEAVEDVPTEEDETKKIESEAVPDKEPSRITQTFDFDEDDVPVAGDDVHRLPSLREEASEEERESEVAEKQEVATPSKVVPVAERRDRMGVIRGHRPAKVFEHSADAVCCLSLKTWAVWLLEITHNAHNWTRWMGGVIARIKDFALAVRGGGGLKKSEWRRFAKETEENVIAWRQYSAHVKELSQSIVDNFRGRRVRCCPRCLEDHLIANVTTAHETLRALTEAVSCAAYWQRCLDALVEKTSRLAADDRRDPARRTTLSFEVSPPGSSGSASLEDAFAEEGDSTGESVYEIEAI